MATDDVAAQFRAEGVAEPRDRVVQEFRTNRYDDATGTLVFTDRQAAAFENIQRHYAAYFGENSTKYGLLPNFITDKAEIHDIAAFFAWTAWASAAERPGHNYTYTNNWPSEPRVDNGPTAQLIVWSTLSLVALLGGTGIIFAIYGRWSQKVGWQSAEAKTRSGHLARPPRRPEPGPANHHRKQTQPWGIEVRVVEIKDVEIPESMQRAMAREAEAERVRRAKIINARGELQASDELRAAAETLSKNPASLQLRYLQTLLELDADHNSTVVFPLPVDIIAPFLRRPDMLEAIVNSVNNRA